jgi:argininosuccinate lyase
MPFRDAHEAVARAVRLATQLGCTLEELPIAELQRIAPGAGADVQDVLRPEVSVAARNHRGGTAPAQVDAQIGRWRERLAQRP